MSNRNKGSSTTNQETISRSKKRNQFELVYAYSEKDKTIEKITLEEFKLISFEHPIPNLMTDIIKYLTGHEVFRPKMRIMKTPNFESLDVELNILREQVGSANYQDLVNGFLSLAANPEALIDSHWYITQESMHKNFAKVFGEYNEYFGNVFYYYLSNGKKKIKVPLARFAKVMHPFLGQDKVAIMENVFYFYDINQDGAVTLLDLLHASSFVPCDSQFGQEINSVVEMYMNKVVLPRKRRLINDIRKSIFDMFLETSGLVSELLSKLFKRSYKGWPQITHKSIFTRQYTFSDEEYNKKMKFYHKMYTDLYDDKSCEVVGATYDRINAFKSDFKLNNKP